MILMSTNGIFPWRKKENINLKNGNKEPWEYDNKSTTFPRLFKDSLLFVL